MKDISDYTQEELEELLEKSKRELQEQLDRMTPEEREQAEIRWKKMIEEDNAAMQELLDSAARLASGSTPKEKETPNFCGNCGAPASGGKFCTYCGSPL